MFEITRGKINVPPKIVIYGVEGVGKTTLCSKMPNPLFIDTEQSTYRMDVNRLPAPTTWEMLLEEVKYVYKNPEVCKTLIIDTLDWAEKLAIDAVLAEKQVKGIEDISYGAGYKYVYEKFGKLLNGLSMLPNRGIAVVCTAHSIQRRIELPEAMGSFDHYELKLQDSPKASISKMVREWPDALLFCNYYTQIIGGAENKKGKAMGNKRVIYTNHRPFCDAKNRFGLAEQLDLSYESIASLFEDVGTTETPKAEEKPKPAPKKSNLPKQDDALLKLADLLQSTEEHITVDEVLKEIYLMGYYPDGTPIEKIDPDFITGRVIPNFAIIKNEIITKIRK